MVSAEVKMPIVISRKMKIVDKLFTIDALYVRAAFHAFQNRKSVHKNMYEIGPFEKMVFFYWVYKDDDAENSSTEKSSDILVALYTSDRLKFAAKGKTLSI